MEDNRKTGLNGQGKKGSDLSQQLDRLFSSLNMSRKKDGVDKVKSDAEHLIFEDNRLEESLTEKLMKDMNKGSVHMSTDSSDEINGDFGLGLDFEKNAEGLNSNDVYKDLNIDNPMPNNMTFKNPDYDESILTNHEIDMNYDAVNGSLDIDNLNLKSEILQGEKHSANSFENPNYTHGIVNDMNFDNMKNTSINYETSKHNDIMLDDAMLESLNIDKSILEESNYEKAVFEKSIVDERSVGSMGLNDSIFTDAMMTNDRLHAEREKSPVREEGIPRASENAGEFRHNNMQEGINNRGAHAVNNEYFDNRMGEQSYNSQIDDMLNDEKLFHDSSINHSKNIYQADSLNGIDEKIAKFGMNDSMSDRPFEVESESMMNIGNQRPVYQSTTFSYDDSVNSQTVPQVERKIAKENGLIDYKKIIDENQLMDVESIYEFNNLLKQMGDTIFMVELYSRTLPENLPNDAKRATVLNILKTSSIDVQSLLKDARDRIDSLKNVNGELVNKIEELDKNNLAEIEALEKRIQEYRFKIQKRDQYKKSQHKVIATEIQRIMNIVDFIQG